MTAPAPCHFVIFGATGDLASRKLLPALYSLDVAGQLEPDLRLIAFARRDWRARATVTRGSKVRFAL